MKDSLIEYPCPFPIKIMGKSGTPRLVQSVVEIVLLHDPDFDPAKIEMRASREGKYVSLTCTVKAVSRKQLDSLYQALCDHPGVVMVL